MSENTPMKPARQETLQERSARLEAEAAQLAADQDSADTEAAAGAGAPGTAQPAADSAEHEALKAELAQAKDQMLRALADAENARKRSVKEREDAGKYAIAGFARDLIDVADNLRRALDAVPRDAADERITGLVSGIEATERELLKSFEKNGVRRIDPMGQAFDPNFHEVMFESPGSGKPPGTIVHVLEVGYILNDRLLRPARVGVAKDEGQGGAPPSAPPGGHIDTQA